MSRNSSRVEGTFRNRVGVQLVTSEWAAHGSPVATVLFVPGYNHYQSPFYDWLAARLTPLGIACFGVDLESFGRSVGARADGPTCSCRGRLRAYVPRFDDLLQDVMDYSAAIKAQHPSPLFLHGESMGGGLSILACTRRPELYSGCVLVAPMAKLNTASHPPAWLQLVGSVVSAVLPWAPIAPVTDIAPVCFKDPIKRAEVLSGADPNRYHGTMRLATALQLRDAARTVQDALQNLRLPVLIQQGTADLVTPLAGQSVHAAATACKDRTLILYEQAWHAMYAEPVDTRRQLFLDTLGWLAARVPLLDVSCATEFDGADVPLLSAGVNTHTRPEGVGSFRDDSVWSASHHAVQAGAMPVRGHLD